MRIKWNGRGEKEDATKMKECDDLKRQKSFHYTEIKKNHAHLLYTYC